MLDAAPGGLQWVNRGTDANRLTDLLKFMSNERQANIWDTETFKVQYARVE